MSMKWSEVKWINEWLSEWMTTYLTDFAGATKVAPSVPEKTSARGQESYVSMF
jgi:predicted TIM-barrel fold metal-dependent hydrolase